MILNVKFRTLIFLPLPPKRWDHRHLCDTMPSVYSAGSGNQGFNHTRRVLYQLSHIPRQISLYKIPGSKSFESPYQEFLPIIISLFLFLCVFLKIYLSFIVCMCLYTWVRCPQRPENGVGIPVARVIGSCEPPNIGTGNWSQVFRESSTHC